jgi:hypothetical protein
MTTLQESLRSVLREHILDEAAKGWKKGTVQLATRSGKESAQGYSKEGSNIVVHKALGGGSMWVISHAPSGMAAVKDIVSQKAATQIADELISQFPDFAKADKKEVNKIARTQGREIHRAIQTLTNKYNKKAPTKREQQRQQAKQDKEAKLAAQDKANKQWFDAQAKKYSDAVFKQFIRYSEQSGLSLRFDMYMRRDDKGEQQRALHDAFEKLKSVRSMLGFAEKGLRDDEHKSKTEKDIKAYESALKKLKKMGIDISKTPEKVETYLVRYDYQQFVGSHDPGKLGNAGPKSDGVIVQAASAYEAEKLVGDQQNKNPYYLKAEVMK